MVWTKSTTSQLLPNSLLLHLICPVNDSLPPHDLVVRQLLPQLQIDQLSAEAEKKLELLKGAGVNIVPFERVVEITKDSPDDVVIHLSDDSQHRVGWIVHEPGSVLTIAHLVLQLGVERNDRRNIIVNTKNETNVRGVFAAGDCLSKSKHIMPAVNEGYIAGKSILN